MSKLNHEANSAPWIRIAERLGLQVKFWSARDPLNAVCDPNDLKLLLSEKTRLVACPHTSNLLGSIVDVKAIAQLVHQFPRVGGIGSVQNGQQLIDYRLFSVLTAWRSRPIARWM